MMTHGSRTFMFGITVATFLASASSSEARGRDFCGMTARTLFEACKAAVMGDELVAKAICINVSDATARDECVNERQANSNEAKQLCRDQRDWRLDACKSLGTGRYDPNFDATLFDDPKSPTNPNAYFPLAIGNRWVYRSPGNEDDTVEVADETKQIAGVQCIVVRDLVTKGGDLIEATDDWYAHAKDGNTWYFGEKAEDFESFEGDAPRLPELVSIEGSFKAGRDRDKPGIIALASPTKGDVYIEEFSLANAEDVTEILSATYEFGSDSELDRFVPQQLAARFCSGNCVVTKNFSLLEPGIVARKYSALGIGVFLEVELDTGEVVQLVDCNFDPRCTALPTP